MKERERKKTWSKLSRECYGGNRSEGWLVLDCICMLLHAAVRNKATGFYACEIPYVSNDVAILTAAHDHSSSFNSVHFAWMRLRFP